jgi:secretion/DNA translocation related TadE-like protein
MNRRRRRPAGERGSATVWVVALAGVLAAVGAATVLVGAAVVARHRAATAADLAALAAAGRAVVADADPCASAARVAGENGAVLRGCSVDDRAVAEVVVAIEVDLGPLGRRAAIGRARAGPVPPDVAADRGADPGEPGGSEDQVVLVRSGGGSDGWR